MCQQLEDKKVEDSEDEPVYEKDAERSDEDKETSVDEPNNITMQIDYEHSDYDETYFWKGITSTPK